MLFLKFTTTAVFCVFFVTLGFAQPDMDEKGSRLKDQVIQDDLIVVGSACVGFDCVNGESFGFETIRLKENNLRIGFHDTSTSSSFPSNDWQITINDSANGGQNKFSIDDITGGRTPFTLEAGAPSHSLYVDDGGRLGLGTSTPVVDIHVKSGNTPTLRLEQDGSSGFTAQTWDVAGNEAGFFVRDATNGSTLPFRIMTTAPSQSLVIDKDGEVVIGNGTEAAADLHVKRNDNANGTLLRVENTNATLNPTPAPFVVMDDGKVGIGTSAPSAKLHISGGDFYHYDDTPVFRMYDSDNVGYSGFRTGTSNQFIIDVDGGANDASSYFELRIDYSPKLTVNDLGNVGIGTTAPNAAARLDVRGGQIFHEGAMVHSDKRFKSNIKNFEKGLTEVLELNPVIYNYNGMIGLRKETQHVGILAQELRKYVPELVEETEYFDLTEDGKKSKIGNFLAIKDNEVKYLFINAFKDQQAIIIAQDQRIEQLEQSNQVLSEQISKINEKLENLAIQDIELEGENGSFLKQNSPNPFNGETSIGYFISKDSGIASIQITDMTGRVIRTVSINQKGAGQLNVKANNLPRGNYNYSLIVDGGIVGTNKMVLAR